MRIFGKCQSPKASMIFFLGISLIFIYGIFYTNTSSKIWPNLVTQQSFRVRNITKDHFHVRIDLTSSSATCQNNDYLLIYILSTANNIERRSVIRSTWASKRPGVCFVFILAQVVDNPVETQLKIDAEKQQHQDIVQINHNESYANVVYKEVAALQWSQRFYPKIPYLFKTDDDLIVDSMLVVSIVQLLLTNVTNNDSVIARLRPDLVSSLQSSNRTSFFRGGWSMDYQPTVRGDPKFGVSEDVWPNATLPLYCSGFGWFMSNYVRDRLVYASYIYPLNKVAWIGDVFVSGFLARVADVKCTEIYIDYEQTDSANCSCLMKNNLMTTVCSSSFHSGGGGTEAERYDEYRKAWRVIQLRHNSTNMTTIDC